MGFLKDWISFLDNEFEKEEVFIDLNITEIYKITKNPITIQK